MFGRQEARPRLSTEEGLHKVKAVKAPCAVHSHNDEVRAVPLWDALEHGMLFIEPDVIHRDGQLFIAHNEDDIAAEDTLATLYLEPLYALLSALHPEPPSGAARPSIYPSAPDQPLYLVVDFKFGGKEYLDTLLRDLEPLQKAGWLSRVEDGKLIESAITVVISGRWEPLLDDIQAMQPRHVFVDGPLLNLSQGPVDWTPLLAPLASGNAKKAGFHTLGMSTDPPEEMTAAVQEAHRRGIKARWWGLPEFPELLRHRSWKIALNSGADILNADYLPEAVVHLQEHLGLKGQSATGHGRDEL